MHYVEHSPKQQLISKPEYIRVSLVRAEIPEDFSTTEMETTLAKLNYYDSELTRGHETLNGTPTAALRRRKRLELAEPNEKDEIVIKTSGEQEGESSKLSLLEILDLAKVIIMN